MFHVKRHAHLRSHRPSVLRMRSFTPRAMHSGYSLACRDDLLATCGLVAGRFHVKPSVRLVSVAINVRPLRSVEAVSPSAKMRTCAL